MEIQLRDVGKKYEKHWVIRHLKHTFNPGKFYAVTGPNGSGKSSLIKMLSGYLTPTTGSLIYHYKETIISPDNLFRFCSLAAPFTTLPEEFSLKEIIQFHGKFKPYMPGITVEDMVNLHGYPEYADAPLENFSSGMLQRAGLIIAICTNSPLLLLDEPTSYLDARGKDWFIGLLDRFRTTDRLVIMATNSSFETSLAEEEFNLTMT